MFAIDLGYSKFCVSIYENNAGDIVRNKENEVITSSSIILKQKGVEMKISINDSPRESIYGYKVLLRKKYSEIVTHEDWKLIPYKISRLGMLDESIIEVENEKKTTKLDLVTILSKIIQKAKKSVEKQTNQRMRRVVIGVPEEYNENENTIIVTACLTADLEPIIVPTSLAALYRHKSLNDTLPRRVAIIDYGGGSFNVSIYIEKQGWWRREAWICTMEGGEQLTRSIMKSVINQIYRESGYDITTSSIAIRKLRAACEKTKKELSSIQVSNLEVFGINGQDINIKITRDMFDSLNVTIMQQCSEIIRRCLIMAGIASNDIDEVVMTGGSSRVPIFQKMIREIFSHREISRQLNANESIAYGLAEIGGTMTEETFVQCAASRHRYYLQPIYSSHHFSNYAHYLSAQSPIPPSPSFHEYYAFQSPPSPSPFSSSPSPSFSPAPSPSPQSSVRCEEMKMTEVKVIWKNESVQYRVSKETTFESVLLSACRKFKLSDVSDCALLSAVNQSEYPLLDKLIFHLPGDFNTIHLISYSSL